MPLKNIVPCLLLCAVFILIFTNCASLTGFQTGRTVGQNNAEVLLSLNASKTPDFDLDVNQNDTSDIGSFYFPNFEISGRYGIIEKLDIGARVNTNANLALDGRYQFIGDQTSPVAVAGGLGIGTFGVFSALWNVQLPLYFSLHPTESVAIYINPRYTRQFGTGNLVGRIDYLGGNVGVLFGKKVQVGLDAGLHNLGSKYLEREAILTFGVGVKFQIGLDE